MPYCFGKAENKLVNWSRPTSVRARKFKIYPGAGHGFFANYRQSFCADAARDAWLSMQAWFKKYPLLG
jgi:dienelactone hydrolase